MKPYYDDGRGHVIYHGDAREIVPALEPLFGRPDVVLTDPPYGDRTHAGARTSKGNKVAQYGGPTRKLVTFESTSVFVESREPCSL